MFYSEYKRRAWYLEISNVIITESMSKYRDVLMGNEFNPGIFSS